jgi:hypothetical protein
MSFSFIKPLPLNNNQRNAKEIADAITELRDGLTTFNPDDLILPSKVGGANKALSLNAGETALVYNTVARTDASSFISQDILVHDGSLFTRLGKGAEGQLLGVTSGNLAYRTVASGLTDWEIKTSNFNATDKGQYSINTGLNVQLPSPTATINIVVKPAIGQDFTVTPSTLVRAGSEKIANDAANYTMNINAEYKITSNGTDYDVSVTPIGRV